ncbi:hypothetical protein G3480_04235 [Thiorhodococcus mannitoliphagus]|uniref:Uncharacterized protein n=1 Tax=Thiorhodococcus mannitoliphagus TaxID=329406 RepID=A0A6P1DNC3_9GAMM|nr:hypothetical protein [Thiorhodococcus mannitoliphagus]NEX19528.1 hypothetical protein [Thiorhodococcus mannitoliphagus]
MTQDERPDQQAILAEVFEFSPADIEANRMGKISAAQKARITGKHYANSRFAWIAFAIIFGLGLLGFSAEMIRTENMGVKSLLIYSGFTAFFALIVWAFILYYRHQMNRTLRERKVQSVTGKIRIIGERGEKLTHWYFCVGNLRFHIERSDHRILLQESGVEGWAARVYFSAPWHGLLSVVLQA